METLTGILERFIFYNEENHFAIAELRPSGERHPLTILGNLPGVQCGETLKLEGDWITHPQHGKQFKFKSYQSQLPSNVQGIRKYLGSGLVPGIGKVYADKIVDHFGADTFKIIEHDSGRLREVAGIGPKRVGEIKEAWDAQRAQREVMVFLQSYGVGNALCLKLIKRYGTQAGDVIRANPYQVAREVDGIGFLTADRIAQNLGFALDAMARLDAGIQHVLSEAEGEGHTALPAETLRDKATELLGVAQDLIAQRINDRIVAKELHYIRGDNLVQSIYLAKAEARLGDALTGLLASPSGWPSLKVEAAIDWAQERAGFTFASEQVDALRTSLTSKVSVLTGGPGTGKTTILRALVEILRAKKLRLKLAAPTGRAAQRLSESARMQAGTLHRVLQFDAQQGGFTVNAEHPLDADCVIVDEASMLDTRLAAALFTALPPECHLLLVGDAQQLPSVGAGQVLGDLIASRKVAVTELKQIFRQGKDSPIVTLAHQIIQGRAAPPAPLRTLEQVDPAALVQFVVAPEPESCGDAVVHVVRQLLPRWEPRLNPLMDIQVLAPMHRGPAGIGLLNEKLQAAWQRPGRNEISLGSTVFREGDKVIQNRNNYDLHIFNGDLGQIKAIDAEEGMLQIDFGDRLVELNKGDLGDLTLAYAISVHKSQGSEFPVVVIPLVKQHFILLQRNLLYTGLTRGKRRVILVGDPNAYAIAVRRAEGLHRITGLPVKLAEIGAARPEET
ncbi:MAG: exodeoxyribonuclease V alpha subunit [Puniceicoccaceae bacterium 5H]|nr:MAG: exodeoxyribonuclease V alpha subunit [Puniceicoccaceae bacterium 5H]